MSDDRGPNPPPLDTDLEEVFGRITDAVYALDEEWRFTYLNERAERLFQRDGGDLRGTIVWDAIPDAVQPRFKRKFERAMATQTPTTFEEHIEPLNARFEVRAYPSETGLTVCFREVTQRVGHQGELEERERALRRAYDIIADSDMSFRKQLDALLDVVRETLGIDYATLSRVQGETYVFEAVVAPDDADLHPGDSIPLEATNCERVVTTEQTLVLNDVESDAPELADKSGNAEWGISCYLGAPVSVGEEVYGTFCFYDMEARVEDFSDWQVTFVNLLSKWVGTELERQRENDRLDSFASMVAHELRNPLHIAQLYQEQAAEGDESAAEEVAVALDRIEAIIDVILVTARGTKSVIDWEPVSLTDAAAEVWAEMGAADAELVVETDRTVETDSIHLRHLLENLFSNAVEHGGSEVTVSVGDLPDGFYVADDGEGIPVAEREQVFEAGYTTDETGIGLGLTFVKRLADTYDWQCRVAESDAGGARFEFTNVEIVSQAASR
ncbi:sensor histidine kinase [Halorussus pelagicus]|uniref:sensor histidine kinase n=1 Tax=Halorussus pelagicus TaxID=2505977 RepID=UPI000FFC4306|nr:ATP-binding protein [Halorussus pelagicus]